MKPEFIALAVIGVLLLISTANSCQKVGAKSELKQHRELIKQLQDSIAGIRAKVDAEHDSLLRLHVVDSMLEIRKVEIKYVHIKVRDSIAVMSGDTLFNRIKSGL